jgi:hypothetical protein
LAKEHFNVCAKLVPAATTLFTFELLLMPVWKRCYISVEAKTIVMWIARRIGDFGAEVWAPSTKQRWAAIDIVQTDMIS